MGIQKFLYLIRNDVHVPLFLFVVVRDKIVPFHFYSVRPACTIAGNTTGADIFESHAGQSEIVLNFGNILERTLSWL